MSREFLFQKMKLGGRFISVSYTHLLIHDLVKAGKIKLNETGKIDEKETIQNIPQTKAFVRFIVRSSNFSWGELEPDECWRDRSLQECYIEYTRSLSLIHI